MGILTGIILAAAIAGLIILNLPAFGRLPRGSRLERILQSPNYRDGQFRNLEASPMMTGDKSRLSGILEFLFRKKEGLRPSLLVVRGCRGRSRNAPCLSLGGFKGGGSLLKENLPLCPVQRHRRCLFPSV